MENKRTHATPSIRSGKSLLTPIPEADDPVEINKIIRYVNKQKPENMKLANLRKNDCLNSHSENIIFNNSNNMILNSDTLNSFFEKLAEINSSNTVMSISQSTVETESSKKTTDPSMSFKGSGAKSYSGQKMAGNTYMGSKSEYGTQDINRVRKVNLR